MPGMSVRPYRCSCGSDDTSSSISTGRCRRKHCVWQWRAHRPRCSGSTCWPWCSGWCCASRGAEGPGRTRCRRDGCKGPIGVYWPSPWRGVVAMTMSLKLDALDALPRTPASDVKKLGWRGVMKTIARGGKVVVTNHNTPEAVILSADEYDAILRALDAAGASQRSALDTLRARFDERLAALEADDAGARLRAVMAGPARLDGKVKAGATC
ncbi:hypothetical protein CNR27_04380 [Luteimonas chenhongjianii]|uniref:Uncharacterized protein n=2 Tax=Lysobacteraceae TaxID=32033 RepID=A0A290XHR1_9GAMM|nr:hypothetical protein CNR27_04380 [Luteimonas chenhongjianii]